jgi:hypothetical protein
MINPQPGIKPVSAHTICLRDITKISEMVSIHKLFLKIAAARIFTGQDCIPAVLVGELPHSIHSSGRISPVLNEAHAYGNCLITIVAPLIF